MDQNLDNLRESRTQSITTSSSETRESNQIEESPKFSSQPKYVLFGTFKCEPRAIEFYANGIKFNFVDTNNHLMIQYVEMSDFYYCVDRQQPSIFIKPTQNSNSKIKNALYSGEESQNDCKFDTNSGDIRQRFIIAVFNDQLSNSFVDTLKNMMQMNNISVNIKALSVDETKLMLIGFQTTNSSSHPSSSSSSTANTPRIISSIGCQIPEIITIDAEDITRSDSINNNNNVNNNDRNNDGSNENESTITAEINSEIASDTTEPTAVQSSSSVGSSNAAETTTNNTENESILNTMNESESNQTFRYRPQYVMFGTYKCEPKTIEFDSDGIKFTTVLSNSLPIRYKYHIMLPYLDISEFNYCVDRQQSIMFIKTSTESNRKIQENLFLGLGSKGGFKFDINSSDFRERLIIAVFAERLSNRFVGTLKNMMQVYKESIIINAEPLHSARELLRSVSEKNAKIVKYLGNIIVEESRKNSPKVINSRLRYFINIRNALKPYDVNASPTKSKHAEQTRIKSAVEYVVNSEESYDQSRYKKEK